MARQTRIILSGCHVKKVLPVLYHDGATEQPDVRKEGLILHMVDEVDFHTSSMEHDAPEAVP